MKTATEVLRALVADIEAMSLGNNQFGTGNSEPVGDWECTSEFIEWPNLAILLEEAKAVLVTPAEPPKVVVVLEGGLVSAVLSTEPMQYGLIDYDAEGADLDEVFTVPQGIDEPPVDAVGHTSETLCDPVRAQELFDCIGGATV